MSNALHSLHRPSPHRRAHATPRVCSARRTRPSNQHQSGIPAPTAALVRAMRPPYLRVSVTADCNALCSFCHNEGQKCGARGGAAQPAPAKLSEADYQRIARVWRHFFGRVKFTGGEPTLVRNLPNIIRIFANEGYSCSMTTNGFLFDEACQLRLRDAGLSAVNVSLHTTNPNEHAEAYGVRGQLDAVVNNLHALCRTFPQAAKINFMALPERNVPSQLLPMTDLSANTGLPISFLAEVNQATNGRSLSEQVIDHLAAAIGIRQLITRPKAFSLTKIIEFRNGGVWEIDDFRGGEYRTRAFDNAYCRRCPKLARCAEGPYALRIMSDGTARPCLIRTDNIAPFRNHRYVEA